MTHKLFILFCLFTLACTTTPEERPAIEGTWSLDAFSWSGPDTVIVVEPAQPGIFIFDEAGYSIQWSPIREPRTPFGNLSQPTDEEIIAGFRSVIFNAGNVSYTDSTLNTTARIAKVPGFEGGQQFYEYSISDEDVLTLSMVDETYPNGDKPDWAGKWVTTYTLKRLE
ncbi:MAG: hypothetical protein KTR13_10090 [Saprospiraceae bacterium]|nr:hypothetical protein [Saprospiraceae bacterium]